ncbi:MAG: hypothetical protein KKC79_05485 [Gammaproteobacteria bacterium]|nr:hypothetical protein [Gammaproteobacteria bacterium]MBU2288630.1 hypothetical protein [Gammaproteobacteria bacterium]MBU2408086.1 hypothetical protein [Gammaproteobacteria bacterium]
MLAALGSVDEVAGGILGHLPKGIVGTYNSYSYDRERRKWLAKLSSYIGSLQGVPMPDQVSKRARSEEENTNSLRAILKSLVEKCGKFDLGRDDDQQAMKESANLLRTLLHDSSDLEKKGNTSLLETMGLRRKRVWLDASTAPLGLSTSPHSFMLVVWANGRSLPAFIERFRKDRDFEDWWNEPVARSPKFGAYTRRGLVRSVADFDASHIDQMIPDRYAALYDGSYMNVSASDANAEERLIGSLASAAIRQIGHETLLTIEKHCPAVYPYHYTWFESGFGLRKVPNFAAGEVATEPVFDRRIGPAFVLRGATYGNGLGSGSSAT